MTTYILVHGSFHGGWCWDKVVPHLESLGARAIAIDLPGHGAQRIPASQASLAGYVDHVCQVVAEQQAPVVLVGHSMAGMVVSGVAERLPEAIRKLVFVCAFLPQNGQALVDLARTDNESLLMPALVFDEPNGVHFVRDEGAREAFYHDCPEDLASAARARLIPEPLSVVTTPVSLSERFAKVPRDYIHCTEDHALGPSLQRRMLEAQPCRVHSIPSSHSPFYSMPERLAQLLVA